MPGANRSVVMSFVTAQKLSMKADKTFMKRMASIGFGKFKKDMSMGGLAAPMAAPTTAAPTRSFSDGAGAGAGVRAHAGSFDGAGAGLAQSGSGLAAGSGAAGGGAGGGCRAHSGSSAILLVLGCLYCGGCPLFPTTTGGLSSLNAARRSGLSSVPPQRL